MPRYYDSVNGRYKCIYTSQCIRRKGDYAIIKLNKEEKLLYIETKGRDICQITILPVANGYAIDVSFRVPDTPLKDNNGRYAAGDLGVDNLLTLTSNIAQATIIDGKRIKSINQYYNKKTAYLKSCLCKNRYASRRIRQITNRRNNKVKDYLHKASNVVIEYCVSNDIAYIIIGKNDKWKNECRLSKQVNQNFIMIPHSKLIDMIKCNCDAVMPADKRFVYNPVRLKI